MTALRWARRADDNASALRDGFRKLGGSWLDLVPETGGEPDALLGWRGQDRLVEVKNPQGKRSARRPRAKQLDWHRSWRGRRPAVVETLAEIVALFQ